MKNTDSINPKEIKAEKEKNVLDLPKIFIYLLESIALILAVSFIYFSINGPDYTNVYSEKMQTEIVDSLVVALKLYNLHEIPYTAIIPRIQIYIKENTYFINAYYIEVSKGEMNIKNGETGDKDIIIRTTKEEVLKIVQDNTYIKESLAANRTTVQKATSDFILFTKGYSNLFWRNDF